MGGFYCQMAGKCSFLPIFLLVTCLTCCRAATNDSFIQSIHTTVFYQEELKGNLILAERWTYHFDTPHTQVFRTIPAGYSPSRQFQCDAIGNIFVLINGQYLQETAPSLYTHTPNTFEVFEDPAHLHIYVYFPPTTGTVTITYSYEIAGGIKLSIMPLLSSGFTRDSFTWPVVISNNPLPIHNVTLELFVKASGKVDFKTLSGKFLTPDEPPMQLLAADSPKSTHNFTYKVTFAEGAAPIPAYTPYSFRLSMASFDMADSLKIANWHRKFLLEYVKKNLYGFTVLIFTVLPLVFWVYYRSPVYIWKGISKNSVIPKPDKLRNLLRVRLLLDGNLKNRELLNVQIVQWIAENVIIVNNGNMKLSPNYKSLLKNDFAAQSTLETLFYKQNSSKLTSLSVDEFKKRRNEHWNNIWNIEETALRQQGFLWKPKSSAQRDTIFFIVIEAILSISVYFIPFLNECVSYWLYSGDYQTLAGVCFVVPTIFIFEVNTRTKEGAKYYYLWKLYIEHLSSKEDTKDILDLTAWGGQNVQQSELSQWITESKLETNSSFIHSLLSSFTKPN